MKQSRGTEIKITNINDYNVTFGAINKLNPKSLYIKITAWGSPISLEAQNYKTLIRLINKEIKQKLYFNLNKEFFNVDRTMVDFNMRQSGIKYGKPSFMNCEITLFQIKTHLLKSEILIKNLTSISNLIINDVLNKNKTFKFHKKKTLTKPKLKNLI